MGVKHDVAEFFIRNFEDSGALARVAMFLSLADAPSVERLLTPRVALTLAEHLAFDCGQHVLVLLTDMTNYCESLREVGTARGEIPGAQRLPGLSLLRPGQPLRARRPHRGLAGLHHPDGRSSPCPPTTSAIPCPT